MEHITSFLAWQETFKGQAMVDAMRDHIDIPVTFVTLYLTLIFYIPSRVSKPVNCKTSFAIWNLLLTVFSILGSIHTVPVLVGTIWKHGLRYSACAEVEGFYFNGAVGFWVCLFILSKIPELMDTVFLVVQKKDVIFLHWFHHVTVMLYCWHAYTVKISSGLWFATMNYCVHSIMYFYYFLMAIGARGLVKPIAPLITSLQILQMIVGMAVTLATFIWRQDSEGCRVDPANSRMGLAMYTSYFVLFAILFKKLYLTPKKPKTSTNSGKPVQSSIAAASPTSATSQKDSICNVEGVDGAGHFVDYESSKKKQ
jgi:hypothetical protein